MNYSWTIRPTRFPQLGYGQVDAKLWRIYNTEPDCEPKAVGPHYATKAELFFDLERYATDFGLITA